MNNLFYFYSNKPITAIIQTQIGDDPEQEAWSAIKASSNVQDFEEYLQAYSKGKFVLAAKSKLRQLKNQSGSPVAPVPNPAALELELWQGAQKTDNTESYDDYLSKYPQGKFAVLAKASLEKRKEMAIKAEAQQMQEAEVSANKLAAMQAQGDATRPAAQQTALTHVVAPTANVSATLASSGTPASEQAANMPGEFALESSTAKPNWQFKKAWMSVKKLDEQRYLFLQSCAWVDQPTASCFHWFVLQLRGDQLFMMDNENVIASIQFNPHTRKMTIFNLANGSHRIDVYAASKIEMLNDTDLLRRMKAANSSWEGTKKMPFFVNARYTRAVTTGER